MMKQCRECGEHIPNHLVVRLCAACKRQQETEDVERRARADYDALPEGEK